VNTRTGKYHCFRCGYGGRVTDLIGRKKVTSPTEPEEIGKLKPVPDSAYRVLLERGLSPAYTISRYGIRWDGWRLCFPVGGDKQEPDQWWRRAVFSWQQPKVLSPREEKGILGEHLLSRGCIAVLTEGDYKAASIPLPYVGVACGGVTLTPHQLDILSFHHPKVVMVMFDGGVCPKRVVGSLHTRHIGSIGVVGLPKGQGPDDIPLRERINILGDTFQEGDF
jgi:hypothetical protein